MSAIYFAIPTNAGQAKIANAIALGVPLKITHMAVGDGNGQPVTPKPAQTALVREQRRAPLNTLFQDPLNPAQLVAEQIIPETVGGWWIREVGLFDDTGTLIAIANSPDTYKPQLSEGSGRTQTIRMVLIVSDTSAVELKIDPSVVLATRKYVDDKMADELAKRDSKQSVRVATTGAIALSAAQTIDGVVLAVGDRVLVKDQADAKQNGVYLVAAQAWTRTTDADTGAKLNAGARLYVEEGAVNGGKVWTLATTGAITLGTTLLQFKDEHPAATQQIAGVSRFATQAEAIAGVLDTVAVAPKEMKAAMEALLDIVAPVGVPIQWVAATPPNSRFLIAQGQGFDKVAYPKLGALWPTGVIPFDMRGEFPRGWDNGRGVDAGRAILSAQAQQIMDHTHHMATWTGDASVLVPKAAAVTGAAAITRGDGGTIYSDQDAVGTNNPAARAVGTRGVAGSPGENRPRNIAFNYIVRAA
ncbi:phage tail protein [Aeromonas media]|uniref:phage tail protein n=1 Tax=Aeromonas media TaxID=651 RepID=UPI00148AFBA6|nr:phage tail protein [Aeromonas media]